MITSGAVSGRQSRMSCTANFTRGPANSAARVIISGEESRPRTCAPGQRSASEAVRFPGPQPRSITTFGSAALTRLSRSTNGRERSSANSKYVSGFQTVTGTPAKYRDVKLRPDDQAEDRLGRDGEERQDQLVGTSGQPHALIRFGLC